ncbi:GAF domain-containing protein [Halobaculum magnesiiphilum]|uniref:histidine kinase n=1 Tax=Halobaculum magnesiiphilum TaxID=1017351 RepID=A0A8T8WA33_9EURY|nr:GAF domain-containing protein [Halobaculum magnesiiphilum]QZP36624.1 GAF domain-containing protein [Halobaculum magnesiiphilum]
MPGSVAESSIAVLVVTAADATVPDGFVDALADAVDGEVEIVETDALAERLRGGRCPKAIVFVGDPSLSEGVRDALSTTAAAVVVYAEREPDAESTHVDGYVERAADIDRLLTEIGRAREGETRRQLRAARRRMTELHAGTADIAAAERVEELFERTISVANRVLSFDHCAIAVHDEGEMDIVARSENADWLPERVGVDESIGGRAYRRGETVHVDQVSTEQTHDPDAAGSCISVPFGGDAVFQAIALEEYAFDDTDRELAELLAVHVGQAYERLRTQADLTRRERVMTELHEAAPRIVDAETEDELYDLTVEIARRVLQFDHSCVYVVDDDGFRMRATTDPSLPATFDRGFGALEHSYAEGESLVVDDTVEHEIATSRDGEPRSVISVPFADGAVFQAVADETGSFDERDLEFAELLVSYATVTHERIRSEAALRDARETTERLHVAATELSAAESEDALIRRAIEAASDVLSFDKSTLSLRRGDTLVPVGADGTRPDGARPMDLDEGVAGRTYRSGESVLIHDVDDHGDAEPVRREYRSAISIPVGDLGVFQAVATEPSAFDRDDLSHAELLMAHVAVSLARTRTQADLRAERDRLSALFENVPDAALSFELVDGEPIVKAVNSAFEDTFGFGEEIVGEPIDDHIVPEEAESEAGTFNERLANGESIRDEVRRMTADGMRDFLLYVVPLELDAENVGGYAIYSDISERKERERALRRQNERLDEFASVVSHDLRNPLSVAEGYLELARETGDVEHLATVSDAVERMRALVDDLLRLAREGRVVGDTEPVDVAVAARAAWGSVDTGDATLEVEDGLVVEADEDRLRELFENLFRNSIEHGGSAPTVRVEATPTGFAVADDGPGIPADRREEVFEVGVSTVEDGTGFGLAIVRRIAEAHGWSVTATAGEDGGARFEFDEVE